MLQPYGYDYVFTDSITQDARANAKFDMFGSPDDNVKYAHSVARELKEMGHCVESLHCTRSKVVSKLGYGVLAEEDYRQKYD